jgi:hypothetical protein
MRKKGAQILICPYGDYQNLWIFQNIKEVWDHLIRRGFMDRYTRQVRHGVNIKMIDNIENIIQDESGCDYTNNLNFSNDEWDVSKNKNVKNIENTKKYRKS